jgi:6,7-dimethyl-8-ribityllumazine synthase
MARKLGEGDTEAAVAGSGRGLRVAVVAARFYGDLSERLLRGCRAELAALGCEPPDEFAVPGSFELPLAVQTAAQTGRYDAVVALGVVIRGETAHFDYVCQGATEGLLQASLATGVPVAFGVLTTEDAAQALARAADPGEQGDNKGRESARVVVAMARELERIRKGGT